MVLTADRTTLADLRAQTDDAFLTWSVGEETVLGAWRRGDDIVVVREGTGRHAPPGPAVLALGSGPALADLATEAVDGLGISPTGVTASASAFPFLPASWGLRVRGRWDYMVCAAAPPAGRSRVVDIDEHDEINALLAEANADAHARPGDPAVRTWLGVRDEAGLACVGALAVSVRGGAHLRAISTRPSARGRGLGTDVTAALTRRGMADISDEVTLGVYTDNLVAIGIYERLGYRLVHRFVSAATG